MNLTRLTSNEIRNAIISYFQDNFIGSIGEIHSHIHHDLGLDVWKHEISKEVFSMVSEGIAELHAGNVSMKNRVKEYPRYEIVRMYVRNFLEEKGRPVSTSEFDSHFKGWDIGIDPGRILLEMIADREAYFTEGRMIALSSK